LNFTIKPELQEKLDELLELFNSMNPTEALEQISFLVFLKRLEEEDNKKSNDALLEGKEFESVFKDNEECKWSGWINKPADRTETDENGKQITLGILTHVRDIVFPFIRTLKDEFFIYAKYLKNATFNIENPQILVQATKIISSEELNKKDSFTDGLIYKYMLSQLNIEGQNKQYKTPDHIIYLMMKLVNPTVDDTICDPTCAAGNFLESCHQHILKGNTSQEFIKKDEHGNEYDYKGDKLEGKWDKFNNNTFYGFNVSQSMTRVAIMNLMMHGLHNPHIQQMDTLSSQYEEAEKYSLILCNPPFNNKVNTSDLRSDFTVTATKSIYYYLELIFNLLEPNGGRCAVIVPEGIAFGTKSNETKVKKLLLNEARLDAVIKLHPKIFQPFGKDVSTNILIFTKGEATEKVWFYEMESDGYTKDKKRIFIDGLGDIPDIIDKYYQRDTEKSSDRKSKCFFVDIEEIKENKLDLSFNKYKEIIYKETDYGNPKELIEKITNYEEKIIKTSKEVKELLNAGVDNNA
jgi:type I restriction enzyme M protein